MQTLATGATERLLRRLAHGAARGAGGFTLIEVLVVLVIVAVMTAALVLATGLAAAPSSAEREGRRLARLLELACERALLSGRDYGMMLDRDGYRFAVRGASTWVRFADGGDTLLAPRPWPERLELQLSRDGRDVVLATESTDLPQIGCAASGEMTPFVLQLSDAGAPPWRVRGDFDGSLHVDPPES